MELNDYPMTLTLKQGVQVTIRPMTADDGQMLLAFFKSLPIEDRQFLREDVTQSDVIERFVKSLDYDTVLPLLAIHEGKIVADATLHRRRHGWSSHVGEIRAAVARDFQKLGLGTAIMRLLVRHAISAGLDKMVAEIVDNQMGARRAFERLGFRQEALLRGHVRDIHGVKRDLVILSNDVSHIWETMESMISDFSPTFGG